MMNNIYSIYEYKIAKIMVEDLPKLQQDLDNMLTLCYNWMQYKDIAELHTMIIETKIILDIQYNYYLSIVNNKGIYNGQ